MEPTGVILLSLFCLCSADTDVHFQLNINDQRSHEATSLDVSLNQQNDQTTLEMNLNQHDQQPQPTNQLPGT